MSSPDLSSLFEGKDAILATGSDPTVARPLRHPKGMFSQLLTLIVPVLFATHWLIV